MTQKRIEGSYENSGNPDLGLFTMYTGVPVCVIPETQTFTVTVEEENLEQVQNAILEFGYEIKRIVDLHY